MEQKLPLQNKTKLDVCEDVYAKFYFPAYLRYFKTYSVHTLMAGIWLITGVYNLRRQPQISRITNGEVEYVRSLHATLSGYLYVVSSFLKGATVPLMSLFSHSLGFARYPLSL